MLKARRRRLIRDFYAALPVPPGPSAGDLERRRACLAIYDQLGPLAKAAIEATPQDIELGLLIVEWRLSRRQTALPPMPRNGSIDDWEREIKAARQKVQRVGPLDDPELDAALAAFITKAVRAQFGPRDFNVVRRRQR